MGTGTENAGTEWEHWEASERCVSSFRRRIRTHIFHSKKWDLVKRDRLMTELERAGKLSLVPCLCPDQTATSAIVRRNAQASKPQRPLPAGCLKRNLQWAWGHHENQSIYNPDAPWSYIPYTRLDFSKLIAKPKRHPVVFGNCVWGHQKIIEVEWSRTKRESPPEARKGPSASGQLIIQARPETL